MVAAMYAGRRQSHGRAKALQMLDWGRGTFIQKQEIGRPGDFSDWTYEQLRDYVRCEIADLDGGGNPPLIGSNWYRRLGTLISRLGRRDCPRTMECRFFFTTANHPLGTAVTRQNASYLPRKRLAAH
jgi:hypothetical protein